MWFGCPSVAMRVGGIPEVIDDGKTGLLTRFDDVDTFAATVDSLLTDATRRQALGLAARDAVRTRFSAEKIVPQYEQLYRAICP
jgi:glycosyltransferase involved in cell wall biosynthesis